MQLQTTGIFCIRDWVLVCKYLFYNFHLNMYVVSIKASFKHSLMSLPLPSANACPYRVHRGLSPPGISALLGTKKKKLPL